MSKLNTYYFKTQIEKTSIQGIESPKNAKSGRYSFSAKLMAGAALVAACAIAVFASSNTSLGQNAYEWWFQANKGMIQGLQERNQQALGAIQGMVMLEPHALIRSGWYTGFKYNGDPKAFGFETLENAHREKHPALLLHGAAGSWHYLGDLATALKDANILVYVLSLGAGGPTEERRQQVWEKIEEIRRSFSQMFGTQVPVDIVAHSMGAGLGFDTVFSNQTSSINAQGELEFCAGCVPMPHPSVGRIVTLANPLEKSEVELLKQVNKISDFSNVNAKYDVIMGFKTPGLVGNLSHQADEVDAGHIGIVFEKEAQALVAKRLNQS